MGRPEDVDTVKFTKYSNSKQKPPLPEAGLPKDWGPLKIEGDSTFGEPRLPDGVDADSPIELFQLFFSEELLDRIAFHTNQQAQLWDTEFARHWAPTSVSELYLYLGIVVYMGVHPEASIQEYWVQLHPHAPTHCISKYMGQTRFEQLDRFVYLTAPYQDFASTFGRIWEVSEYIRACCSRYWTLGRHLCVDESIIRFTGRLNEIVTIKTKPTPTGYKIWDLTNDAWVYDWLFHAKGAGRGPVALSNDDELQHLTNTESVPATLLLRHELEPNRHVVWFDNLFTTIPLLELLRSKGIGAAGTVRTTKTKREDDSGAAAPAPGLESGIFGDSAAAESAPTRAPTRASARISARAAARQLHEQNREEQRAPRASARTLEKLSKERFDKALADVKTYHSKNLDWGTSYWGLSRQKTVLEMAWKDSQVVLFASTVGDPSETIVRNRKRPQPTPEIRKAIQQEWGNLPVVPQSIPLLVDEYNHYKSNVDLVDQMISYYPTQRVKQRTWRPLFYFLIEVALNNAYQASSLKKEESKGRGHREFLSVLIEQLFEEGRRPARTSKKRPRMDETCMDREHGEPMKLWAESRACTACTEAGRTITTKNRKSQRPPLQPISSNKRVSKARPRSSYGCALCRIPLCRPQVDERCWKEHLLRAHTKRQVNTEASSTIK